MPTFDIHSLPFTGRAEWALVSLHIRIQRGKISPPEARRRINNFMTLNNQEKKCK